MHKGYFLYKTSKFFWIKPNAEAFWLRRLAYMKDSARRMPQNGGKCRKAHTRRQTGGNVLVARRQFFSAAMHITFLPTRTLRSRKARRCQFPPADQCCICRNGCAKVRRFARTVLPMRRLLHPAKPLLQRRPSFFFFAQKNRLQQSSLQSVGHVASPFRHLTLRPRLSAGLPFFSRKTLPCLAERFLHAPAIFLKYTACAVQKRNCPNKKSSVGHFPTEFSACQSTD